MPTIPDIFHENCPMCVNGVCQKLEFDQILLAKVEAPPSSAEQAPKTLQCPLKRSAQATRRSTGCVQVQVSVLTIDTNPPPVFTRSSRNTASSQRLLPARQALRHEAEEFGVATPPEVGPRHGSKQGKSVENPQQIKVIGKASLGSGAGTHHSLRPRPR